MKKIIIDPGHGGDDSGASYYGTNEKDINLIISMVLQSILLDLGYKVELTRQFDCDVSLYNRVKHANKIDADVFVSIHCNGWKTTVPNGFEIWHMTHSKKGKIFANYIEKSIIESGFSKDSKIKNRGIKTQRFYVLKNTKMIAILFELGFLSNINDLSLVLNPKFQFEYCNEIAFGIENYFEGEK